jgi:hypothetical protein
VRKEAGCRREQSWLQQRQQSNKKQQHSNTATDAHQRHQHSNTVLTQQQNPQQHHHRSTLRERELKQHHSRDDTVRKAAAVKTKTVKANSELRTRSPSIYCLGSTWQLGDQDGCAVLRSRDISAKITSASQSS